MSLFQRALLLLIASGLAAATARAEVTTLRVGHPTPAVTGAYPFARDEGGGIRYAMYDALTWHTFKGKLMPALALSWENESPTTWVFKLRPGVTFSNGKPFDASAVIGTLDAMYDPTVVHPRTADVGPLESYRARDDMTVEIVTPAPDPLLPKRMSLVPIIDPDVWAEIGQAGYARTPVVTGPYTIESWGGNNTRPVLIAREESWRKVKQMTRVEMNVITDVGARISGLLTGEFDIAISLGSDDIAMLEASGMNISVLDSPDILSLALRTVRDDDSPLKDARVRRALNYAVNKQAIVDFILSGTTRVAHQPLSEGLIGYNPDVAPFHYDPDKAKALLAEAGYAGGFDLEFYVYGGLLPGDTLIFQQVAQDLTNVGVRTQMRQVPFPDYVRRLFAGDWDNADGFSIGWMNRVMWDPQRSYEQFSCAYAAPFYCDEEAMPLIAASRTEMDPARREALMQDIVRRLTDQGAALWLVEFSGVVGMRPGFSTPEFRIDGSMFQDVTHTAP
jgi:peptide/nickel transport system substrate-binding protein